MKKFYSTFLLLTMTVTGIMAQNTPVSQMEKLDRGVVAVPFSNGGTGRLVTWRLLGTDDPCNTTFDVLRGTARIASNLRVTNWKDANGTSSSLYKIVTKVNGEAVDTTEAVQAWENVWFKLPLDRPATGTVSGGTYSPNDCSVGDVDGDGEYEIFVKWDPSTSKDNSQAGITDNVYIDCYKLDGTKLWRIDLGRNIRAGAHYTQFQVYDYDGDGKAEMICKTAPGSLDGTGVYVNQATTNSTIQNADNEKDWAAAGAGRINGGHEYLTVFEGLTGKAIHTIAYNPNRNQTSALSEASGTYNWGDVDGKSDTGTYGNRGERYLAATAYLDGPDNNPSVIYCRGYYGYAFIWAVSFNGKRLIPRWLHSSKSKTAYSVTTYDSVTGVGSTQNYSGLTPTSGSGSATMFANGNHNMSIADVDGDGNDDIIWGSAALKHDGTLRYGTGFGHGDAIHLGQMIPDREGMQVFQVHEEKGTYSWDLHDAATGEIIHKGGTAGIDNGRGMAAQLSASNKEWYFTSSDKEQDERRVEHSATTGEIVSTGNGSNNFRMYWDGTVQDALLDGNTLDKYNDSSNGYNRLVTFYNLGPGSTCNSTKNTPNLLADILGDWREELILYSVSDDETYLGIYSSNITTDYAVPTLMHDHTYRMGICWQNTAYNQPPHLGYNLAVATMPSLVNKELEYTVSVGEEFSFFSNTLYTKSISQTRTYRTDGTYFTGTPAGLTKTINSTAKTYSIAGTPTEAGDYKIPIKLNNLDGITANAVVDTLIIHVTEADGIYKVQQSTSDVKTTIYDLYGRQLPSNDTANLPRGIYIIRQDNGVIVTTRKITKE